jgi:hypothetical protein
MIRKWRLAKDDAVATTYADSASSSNVLLPTKCSERT